MVTADTGSGDGPLLINLEAAGALTLVGSPSATGEVLDAWALELATGPLAADVEVMLAGSDQEIADAGERERVRFMPAVSDAIHAAAVHALEAGAILDEAGVASVSEARRRGVAADTWAPLVVMTAGPLPDANRRQLAALASQTAAGVSIITAAEAHDAALPGWTLSHLRNQDWRLEPIALQVQPPHLNA